MKIKRSLRTQLIFQYMVIVIVCMLVIPTAISELLDRQFRTFAAGRLSENETQAAEIFARAFEEKGEWNDEYLPQGGVDFLRWPMVSVKLLDADGTLIREYSHGERKADHGSRAQQTPPNANIKDEDMVVNVRYIIADEKTVGEIRFKCMPFSNSPEGDFLRKFNRIMYYAVALMLIAAAVIAVFMASGISRPVMGTAMRAQQISRGKYKMEDHMSSDITELQTLIDSVDLLGSSLEAQDDLRKRMLSDIAHELRNPVTIIKSHLEAIEDGIWEPTPERIRLTVGEIDRLSVLIREVEKLTNIEGAAHSLALENLDASSIVEGAVLAYDPLYKNKGVELKREIEQDVFMVMDGAKIRQVIENLLSNALRYTDAGGTVSVSLTGGDKEVVVEVADSGIGIAEKDLPYIFERFYRTDVSRARASGGIGIGLAIVKAIVEVHNGSINVSSVQGKGSRFTVRLPRKSASAAAD